MNALTLSAAHGACLGLKGPGAPQWLGAQGLEPPAPNCWRAAGAAAASLVLARLGAGEFFLAGARAAPELAALARALEARPERVYPVLREDRELELEGEGGIVHAVLAQVCNVDFAALPLAAQPIVMTLMIGIAVLIVPSAAGAACRYRIWCDPTFAWALGEQLATVVRESGGAVRGEI